MTSTSNQYCSMEYKQEQVRHDHLWSSCSLFLIGPVKYPYTKNNSHDLHRVITHSITYSCYIIQLIAYLGMALFYHDLMILS